MSFHLANDSFTLLFNKLIAYIHIYRPKKKRSSQPQNVRHVCDASFFSFSHFFWYCRHRLTPSCVFFLLSIALSSNTNESNFGWIFAILILHQKTFAFLPVFICFCRYFAVSLLWAQETEVSKCVRHTIVANLSQEKCAQVMQNLFICMCEFQPNDNKYRLLPQENAIQNSISELYSECEDEKE